MRTDQELEATLRRVMTSRDADPAAADRVLARLETLPPQKRAFAWWPAALMDWKFAPAWPRLAALAAAAVLGISIGLSNVGTRIAADLDLVRVASAEDAGANVFDTDSLTGLRP
ncbi:MAG: hypothetical protein E6G97_13755 [Alphaproteobacteria bacterium]|nr:MAG: hypothetical protein E6G97_13755 [Alphaproteobacteria bacterium]